MKTAKAILPVILVLMPLSSFCFQDSASILPQGVIATNDPNNLPLPTAGYQVYLVGESHGNQQTKSVLIGYLGRLYNKSSIRDVFLEEDQAFEEEAQTFVQGKRNDLPEALCLRADILNLLREFNRGLPVDKMIRVHLIDIDSPEPTIHKHLVSLRNRIGDSASKILIPNEELSTATALPLIDQLTKLSSSVEILGGLRTVRQSLILFDNGLRIHTGDWQGNPADARREEAIAANLLDVIRAVQPGSVLGLYGSTHVQKGIRAFPDFKGGILQFTPLSDRLERVGIRVYRTICYPLTGTLLWRHKTFTLAAGPAASDFMLSNGETIEDILKSAPDSEFFFFDLAKGVPLQVQTWSPIHRDKVIENPSEQFDSYIFLREATPVNDRCPPVSK